jgi:hypothetical protein
MNSVQRYSKEPILYSLKTYSGLVYPLTQRDFDDIKAKIKAGAKLLTMKDNSLIALSNISEIPKNQMSIGDVPSGHLLPKGDTNYNPDGPGYKKFKQIQAEWAAKRKPSGFNREKRASSIAEVLPGQTNLLDEGGTDGGS